VHVTFHPAAVLLMLHRQLCCSLRSNPLALSVKLATLHNSYNALDRLHLVHSVSVRKLAI
jgi:hypothetical protein